jgi:hypothetical protein
MSSPILPVEGPAGPPENPLPVAWEIDSLEARLSAGDAALDASHGSPPPAVLEQIAMACVREEELREQGSELHFVVVPGQRTTIELHDGETGAVRVLSVSEALDIATGEPVA